MDEALVRQVQQRAGNVCEYCRTPRALYPTVPFPIDHIIARQHDGATVLSNLALSCLHCNSHKGPNLSGIDPQTGQLTRLFHPRRHRWAYHFRWEGPVLVGRTAIGRVTVAVLALNDPDFVATRATLIAEGRFAPSS